MSTFNYYRGKAARLGYSLEKLPEADRDDGKYYLRPHANREYCDNEMDCWGLWGWKTYCSSLKEVKSLLESIRKDQLSLRFHGSVTYDEGDSSPRDVNFQCTIRVSCSGLSSLISMFRWREQESSRRAQRTMEEHERRVKIREARKAEREREKREQGDC